MSDLKYYEEAFKSLRVNRSHGRSSPHKPCMLLAVIDHFDANPNAENRIEFSPNLIERYRSYFGVAAGEGDKPNPHFPYFYMRSEGFWHLQPLPGCDEKLAELSNVQSAKPIRELIDSVALDEDLYALLKNKEARQTLTRTLLNHWFDRSMVEVERMLDTNRQVNHYEYAMRSETPTPKVARTRAEYNVRNAAFRRVVLEAYDYRCAATGLRLILPDDSALVEAAHLEEHRINGNDDPCNGMALTRDIHWVMDRGFIAPGPDYKWHISRQVDQRLSDNNILIELDGTDIILPKQKSLWPKEEYLKYRLDCLN
ncbi:MAG: HNH endonuclease [Pseudomonadota bacterium]